LGRCIEIAKLDLAHRNSRARQPRLFDYNVDFHKKPTSILKQRVLVGGQGGVIY
jgi:hypothetical protein